SEEMQRLVCAHELGHAMLHRSIRGAFLEFALFDTVDRLEYEANLFAADFLLEDSEVRSLALEGEDALSMARKLNTNVNLLLLKLSQMNLRGADFHLPRFVRSDFLKSVTDDAGTL
ncbi:MAG: ImmA/IrrE family metallo-endopeptidase, partial [Clostridia bacterium]|nr:ImmA/IrrE family metallo-endopeptidase [Clostridia bacterium]